MNVFILSYHYILKDLFFIFFIFLITFCIHNGFIYIQKYTEHSLISEVFIDVARKVVCPPPPTWGETGGAVLAMENLDRV